MKVPDFATFANFCPKCRSLRPYVFSADLGPSVRDGIGQQALQQGVEAFMRRSFAGPLLFQIRLLLFFLVTAPVNICLT